MDPVNYIAFERPLLGDSMHRYSLNDQYEEAMVMSIIGPEDRPDQWTAVLMTRNGAEFISSSREYRNRYDWVPASWTFDNFNKTWLKPGDEVYEGAAIKQEDVPLPVREERYMTWRARVFRQFPTIRDQENCKHVLSAVWQSRNLEAPAK